VQEVRLLHKLAGHPHIAGINCWFEEKNGDFYLEMPFYPAGTLRAWLTTERPEMHLRVVLRQLLAAGAAAFVCARRCALRRQAREHLSGKRQPAFSEAG
jgi:serine/threonine protein kinase